jgi:hypothetical protein
MVCDMEQIFLLLVLDFDHCGKIPEKINLKKEGLVWLMVSVHCQLAPLHLGL